MIMDRMTEPNDEGLEDREQRSQRSSDLYQTDLERHLFAFGQSQHKPADLPDSSIAERVADLMERLPELYQQAVVLRVREGLDYGQIADRLSVPVGTVKSRMYRARKRLRRMIEELEDLGRADEADPDGDGVEA